MPSFQFGFFKFLEIFRIFSFGAAVFARGVRTAEPRVCDGLLLYLVFSAYLIPYLHLWGVFCFVIGFVGAVDCHDARSLRSACSVSFSNSSSGRR